MVAWFLIGLGFLALAGVVMLVVANARQVLKSQSLLEVHPVGAGKSQAAIRTSGGDD